MGLFDCLIWAAILSVVIGMVIAYDGSRDVFHPLMFLGPMMLFIYGWMPLKLNAANGLEGFFQNDQLVFVETVNVLGIIALVWGCLSCGTRVPEQKNSGPMPPELSRRLLMGGMFLGILGVAAWSVGIVEVGGLREAFDTPYHGGWDDSGYIRDAAMLVFPSFLLVLAAGVKRRIRPIHVCVAAGVILPWMVQAFFTARRGPTFMIVTMTGMGWYLYHNRRPNIIAMGLSGLAIGYLILFLVVNRQSLYLGSDFNVTTDVTSMVEKPDTGNEFIYGTGSLLSSEQMGHFFWGRRYAAQILVRPIPRAIWPTKYADFGVPELDHNAGTGEGFSEALGWKGADGSAPCLVADLWLEFRWLALVALFGIGRLYGLVWRKMRIEGGIWDAQYVILSALSIYLVMQTIEAVLFRLIELSLPMWLLWRRTRTQPQVRPVYKFAPSPAFQQSEAL